MSIKQCPNSGNTVHTFETNYCIWCSARRTLVQIVYPPTMSEIVVLESIELLIDGLATDEDGNDFDVTEVTRADI